MVFGGPKKSANSIMEKMLSKVRGKERMAISYNEQASVLQDEGKLDEAFALLEKSVLIFREAGDKDATAMALGNQALILESQGKLEDALALITETERHFRETGDVAKLTQSFEQKLDLLLALKKYEESIPLLEEERRSIRKRGAPMDIIMCLARHAVLLGVEMKKTDEGLSLINEIKTMVANGDVADPRIQQMTDKIVCQIQKNKVTE